MKRTLTLGTHCGVEPSGQDQSGVDPTVVSGVAPAVPEAPEDEKERSFG